MCLLFADVGRCSNMIRVAKVLSLSVAICFLISASALAETFDAFASRGEVVKSSTLLNSDASLETHLSAFRAGANVYSDLGSTRDMQLRGPVFGQYSLFSGSFSRLLPCMAANNSLCSTWRVTHFPRADIIAVTTPEPGTLILFGSGLIGLGGLIRKHLAR